jgi:hypothetical protein
MFLENMRGEAKMQPKISINILRKAMPVHVLWYCIKELGLGEWENSLIFCNESVGSQRVSHNVVSNVVLQMNRRTTANQCWCR